MKYGFNFSYIAFRDATLIYRTMTSEQVVAFFTQSKIKSLVYEGHNDRKKKDMNENNFVL